jgi:hypothetical protein
MVIMKAAPTYAVMIQNWGGSHSSLGHWVIGIANKAALTMTNDSEAK